MLRRAGFESLGGLAQKRDLVSRPKRQLSQQLCSVVESDLHKWLVERVIVFS